MTQRCEGELRRCQDRRSRAAAEVIGSRLWTNLL